MTTSRTRTRAVVAAASAALVGMTGAVLTLAAPAGAVPGFDFTRLQGVDRYATAAAIARASFPTATTALLANGQNDDPATAAREPDHFPDALAGNYLAGERSAPVLLTTETTLPAATSQALDDLDVTTVVIIGGTTAVSSGQEQQLRSRGFTVERVGGADRYATAAAVARKPGQAYVGSVDGDRTAVVASGVDFPDALVTGPLSYAGKLPLTITDPQKLSPATRSVLTDLDIEHVLIPGGSKAVSDAVEQEIKGLGITVRRFAGVGRTETANLVADYALAELGFTNQHVNLALGLRFPDALSGGPHAGKERSPILLTAGVDALGTATRGWLERHANTLQNGHIFGGTSAVSARVEREAEEAARGDGASPSPTGTPSPSGTASPSPSPSPSASPTTGPQSCVGATASPTATPTASPSPSPSPTSTSTPVSDTPTATTSRPELIGVALVSGPTLNNAGTTDTRDDVCQVTVRYTFDEQVIGKAPVAASFLLIGFDVANRYQGVRAVVESGGQSVLVTFGRPDNLTTTTSERQDVGDRQLADISLAAVDENAVSDNSGAGNPIGDRPIGQSRVSDRFPAGITSAPDLVAVTVSGTAPSNSVRFDFDETVASILKSNGFHVVTADGRDITCSGALPGGTSVTALCSVTGVTADATIIRGYVDSGTVSDEPAPDGADGNLNPLHAERVISSGRTVAPDLVSAQFFPNVRNENNDDQVLFTFDEPVFIGDGTRFVVYQADTDEIRSSSAVRQSDPTQVLATFPDTVVNEGLPVVGSRTPALSNAVGVSVLEGAVIEAGGSNLPNQEDELAVSNPARNTLEAGRTNGPDLLGVTIDSNEVNSTATFVFDEDLSEDPATITATRLVLFKPDGSRIPCRTAFSTGDNTVTCTAFGSGPSNPSPVGATVGTADNGAVEDTDGTPNPEGAAGVS